MSSPKKTATAAEPLSSWLNEKVLTIFALGFSAGLPFPLVYSTLTAWLEDANVERSTISTFAWLGFAYSFKFVWAPIVDNMPLPVLSRLLGRRRGWLLLAQCGVAAALVMMAQVGPTAQLGMFTLFALLVAFSSATQDIVIDAYRIEIASVEQQGILAAAYQYGYRVAFIGSSAGALYIAEFADWSIAYVAMAAAMGLGVLTTLMCKEPKGIERQAFSASGSKLIAEWLNRSVVEPFADFARRYQQWAIVLLLFVLVFRLSDYVLGVLANPFYLDIGFSKAEIATVAKFYGLWVSLGGTAVGAVAVLRLGLHKSLIIATTLIATTNLFFAWLSQVGPSLAMLTTTISADNFAMGFSGTVLIAYLSSLTSVNYTAFQYALLSSAMSFFGKLVAGFAGRIQEYLDWTGFFLFAASIGLPAIILSVIIYLRDGESETTNEASS